MDISPQFIYGKGGLPTDVVISEEWQQVQEPAGREIDELRRSIAAHNANPAAVRNVESFLNEFEEENDL